MKHFLSSIVDSVTRWLVTAQVWGRPPVCRAMLIKRYWIVFLLLVTSLAFAGEFGNYCLLSLSEGHFLKTD
ncbi:MAG: hypothetical protein NT167_31025, partial [Verrucomicrobia bacterium]|nr:hypothetical protein [Verrucomicrobiota bacterium]